MKIKSPVKHEVALDYEMILSGCKARMKAHNSTMLLNEQRIG